MRRLLLLVLAVAACGAPKATGPKWPEPSKTVEDGGESIEPHPSSTYAAAIEKSADVDEDKPAAAAAATPAAASTDDKPATVTTPTAQPVIDEVIMTEEIIIEIDD